MILEIVAALLIFAAIILAIQAALVVAGMLFEGVGAAVDALPPDNGLSAEERGPVWALVAVVVAITAVGLIF